MRTNIIFSQHTRELLYALGSLWPTVYANTPAARRILENPDILLENNARRAVDGIKNFLTDCRLDTVQEWVPLVLRQSEKIPSTGKYHHVWPIQRKFICTGALCNRIEDPSLVLMAGTDFVIENRRGRRATIRFRYDPFKRRLTHKTDGADFSHTKEYYNETIVHDGATELVLWANTVQMRHKNMMGLLSNIIGKAVEYHNVTKRTLYAVLRLIEQGPTMYNLKTLVAALWDVPITTGEEERLERLCTVHGQRYVVTDTKAYRLHDGLAEGLSEGQTLPRGTFLDSHVNLCQFGDIPKDKIYRLLLPANRGLPDEYVAIFDTDLFSAISTRINTTEAMLVGLTGNSESLVHIVDFYRFGEAIRNPDDGSIPERINLLKFVLENEIIPSDTLALVSQEYVTYPVWSSNLSLLRDFLPPNMAIVQVILT
jgi:hypothetical protein